METNPTRMCELFVGLPDVKVLGMFGRTGEPISVHVATLAERPGCPTCGVLARVKDRDQVVLVDLPSYGRAMRLVWHKVRWCCPDPDCPMGSWTEEDRRIAAPRMSITDRAGRWVSAQVGRCARSVAEVARELGCDWHTVNDAVLAYGEALVDEPGRYGEVEALGLDEVLFVRRGRFRRQEFSTSICDVQRGQLLDIVAGRSGKNPIEWLENKGEAWRSKVRYGTLDLSGPYRAVFDKMLPHVIQVADPFHVCKLANSKLDECRRRVQNETLGHRGHKADPLYRCRWLLLAA
ncbi:MAG TPA: ISL3 family transposase [Acidimicrobiales bacterium]|nr:ISL3 family transposase [Acidimicrobiales bacterium]